MSRCFSLTRTGLSDGIPVWTDDCATQRYVMVGAELRPRMHEVRVGLAQAHPPIMQGESLQRASVINTAQGPKLAAPKPGQKGVLVFIDTGYAQPLPALCGWETTSGQPREIAHGREGFVGYTGKRIDEFGDIEYVPEIDTATCYDIGLLLLMPGDAVRVAFQAPGSLVGVVEYRNPRHGPQFRIIENDVNDDYRYQYVSPQAEADMVEQLYGGGASAYYMRQAGLCDW